MIRLAPHIGRERDDLAYELCRKAVEQGAPLVDLLATDAEVSHHLDRTALAKLADPANYVGLSGEMVDRVLSRLKPGRASLDVLTVSGPAYPEM